ncbi:MAG TPA: hypothetical protein VLV16_10780 [Gemmatimonadales bacterium]|nr:hypothetical protein [Gemmatimonadales bacterium]
MRRLRWGWILLLGAALGCLDNGATPGTLKVKLTTPNAGDGAILFTVSGPAPLRSAAAAPSLRLFNEPLAAVNRFAVTGPLTTGTVITIEVPDISRASAYTATIEQVAATNYQLRPSLVGYSLTVAP